MTASNEAPAVRVTPKVRVVRLRRPGRIVGIALVLLVSALILATLITNPRFQWDVVFGYLFNDRIMRGLAMTLMLTVVAMAIGLVLGVLLAVMRVSDSWVLNRSAGFYLWFFRGTPVLVQLVFWYNLGYLFPTLDLGVPFLEPLYSLPTNDVVTPLTAAILGLGLNEAAYLAEIIRAGIISIPQGQHEAATSIGMTRRQAMRRVVLPQAMRVIVPPTGNETIGMLKTTSMVSVIALSDLMYSAQSIYSRTFEVIPLLITVSIWYLALTSVLSYGQSHIERYFGRGEQGHRPRSGRPRAAASQAQELGDLGR